MKLWGWVGLGVVGLVCLPLAAWGSEHAAEAPAVPAAEALKRIEQGEERFVTGHPQAKDLVHDRAALVSGQHPYAIVLVCSDSRVAPEILFDTSIGELFVVRVAGNVVDPDVLGSIEYAAMHLHPSLLLVMGHDGCGAVQATLTGDPAPNVAALAQHIAPAAAAAKKKGLDAAGTLDAAVRENVRLQAERVTRESAPLAELEKKGKLVIVSGVYHLDTGRLELLTKPVAGAAK
jgi:carbonic anhydrase